MFGGPWDSTLNMMGVPSLKLGVPSFYISFEFWKVVHPSVKAQCCPQVSNFEGHVWPPSDHVQPKTPLFTSDSQHPPRFRHAVYLGEESPYEI